MLAAAILESGFAHRRHSLRCPPWWIVMEGRDGEKRVMVDGLQQGKRVLVCGWRMMEEADEGQTNFVFCYRGSAVVGCWAVWLP